MSVIIPVFNGERTIRAAIDSALAQDFADSEVVVVNDGSTDSTGHILEGYRDRIKLVTQPNRGVCAARNVCVAASSGQHLAFLDADDEFLPAKLERSYRALEQNPGAALVFSDLVTIDSRGDQIDIAPIGHSPTMEEMLSRGWPILPTGAVMPRGVFDRCGGFCEDFKRPGGDDAYLWLLAREQGEFIYIGERLALHRNASALVLAQKYRPGFRIFHRLHAECVRYVLDQRFDSRLPAFPVRVVYRRSDELDGRGRYAGRSFRLDERGAPAAGDAAGSFDALALFRRQKFAPPGEGDRNRGDASCVIAIRVLHDRMDDNQRRISAPCRCGHRRRRRWRNRSTACG